MNTLKTSIFLFFVLTLLAMCSSPVNTGNRLDFNEPTNSFESTYERKNPDIKYTYDIKKQVHDYSGNWDLDSDGINDQVFFVGTGGAHLYFFLRVVLSSNQKIQDFDFLISDMPLLPPSETLSKDDFDPLTDESRFAVFHHQKINRTSLYIYLDKSSFYASKDILAKKGVNTNFVILSFNNGLAELRDYSKKE